MLYVDQTLWADCFKDKLLNHKETIYRTRTKFRGINFRALAGSEFRGSIFSCGVIFMDTRCSRSEINFQLRSYTRNVKFITIYPPKWGFLLLPLGYHVSWTYAWERHRELSQIEQCSELLDHARELAVCVEI